MVRMKFNIAVLLGDGIGPEVMAEAVKVLASVEQRCDGLACELTEYSAGAVEFLRNGNPLPESVMQTCRSADAVLLGAMGLPNVRWPDGREIAPQLDLRERLDLYAGIRPVRLFHADDSPLKNRSAHEIDFVVVREQTEGLFFSRRVVHPVDADEIRDVMRISRAACMRVFRSAFQLAQQRRRHVTLVDKANVLPSMVFFRELFDEVAGEYPDIETDRLYIDATSLYLVQRPESFDVLVTENMFGDILSDLSAGLVGGMGVAPSGDIGDESAVFQPAHGSAPDIAGQGIANPVAMILSMAMMLDWLAQRTLDRSERGAAVVESASSRDHLVSGKTRQAAQLVESAVVEVLADRNQRTRDLGGSMSTAQMGDAIAAAIQNVSID